MPWPQEIQEAEDRMNQAKEALLADLENGQAYNAERRRSLCANLKWTSSWIWSQNCTPRYIGSTLRCAWTAQRGAGKRSVEFQRK